MLHLESLKSRYLESYGSTDKVKLLAFDKMMEITSIGTEAYRNTVTVTPMAKGIQVRSQLYCMSFNRKLAEDPRILNWLKDAGEGARQVLEAIDLKQPVDAMSKVSAYTVMLSGNWRLACNFNVRQGKLSSINVDELLRVIHNLTVAHEVYFNPSEIPSFIEVKSLIK